MCAKLAKNERIFITHIIPLINTLLYDKIINVRVTIAFLLEEIYKSKHITITNTKYF